MPPKIQMKIEEKNVCKFRSTGTWNPNINLPTYEMSLKSDNVEFVRYCGGHFENGDS